MNTKQQEALDSVISGRNVLLTGPAGTGKSYSLAHIVSWAHSHGKNIGVTASTGLAAFLIGGRTIHSFLGIGLAKVPAEIIAQKIQFKNKMIYNKLRLLDILVVDEVSMLDADLLDYISKYLSLVKKNPAPFGGIQVVLCGDFCQLPPVAGEFCFVSAIWDASSFVKVILEDLVRQDGDLELQAILSELRWGNCSTATLARLKELKHTVFPSGVVPTKLFPTNKFVDVTNSAEYAKLKATGAKVGIFKTTFGGAGSTVWGKHVPEFIELCVGAQVLVTMNLQGTDIVNGTRGVIVDISSSAVIIQLVNGTEAEIPYVGLIGEDSKKDTVNYMPLKLAYAISIHKSQGMTLDAVEIDIGSSVFECGQAYVAISRARSIASIRVVNVKASSFKVHPLVKDFYGV